MKEIEYNFGSTYYFNKMISVPQMMKCMYCVDGTHTRIGDNKKVNCPICNGVGEIENGGSLEEMPRKCFLKSIHQTEDDIIYEFKDEYDDLLIISHAYDDIDVCIEHQSKGIMGYTV